MSSKINDLQTNICKLSYPQKKVLKFLMGGEGVVAVGENCGYIRPTEKTKIEKCQCPTIPLRKKEDYQPTICYSPPLSRPQR